MDGHKNETGKLVRGVDYVGILCHEANIVLQGNRYELKSYFCLKLVLKTMLNYETNIFFQYQVLKALGKCFFQKVENRLVVELLVE